MSEKFEPIIDFEIISSSFNTQIVGSSIFSYTLILAIILAQGVEVHEVIVKYKQSSNMAIDGEIISTSKLLIKKDLKDTLIEVLTSFRQENEHRVYL